MKLCGSIERGNKNGFIPSKRSTNLVMDNINNEERNTTYVQENKIRLRGEVLQISEEYLGPPQKSKMENFTTILNS